MTMISESNYELYYDMYLAESELYDNMMSIANGVVAESTGLISLQEDVKATIKTYLNKVAQAIQKAWNKFTEFFKNAGKNFVNKIKTMLGRKELGFEINNYQKIDFNKLKNIKLTEFNYEQMKPYLVSTEAYIKQYFPQIEYDKDKDKNNFATAVMQSIVKTDKATVTCNNGIMEQCIKYVQEDYQEYVKDTQQDIDTVNKSFTDIANKVSTEENSTQATSNANTNAGQQNNNEAAIIGITNESISLYESYLTEAPTNNPNGQDNKDNNKMTFDDSNVKNDAESNNNGQVQGQGKNTLVKEATNWTRVNIGVLTGKMNVIKNIYKNYMKIITHYAQLIGVKTSEGNDNNQNQEQPKDVQVQTVKTDTRPNVEVKNQ